MKCFWASIKDACMLVASDFYDSKCCKNDCPYYEDDIYEEAIEANVEG